MTTKKKTEPAEQIHIEEKDLYPLFKSNFYQYGMFVILSRAFPDIRDGLKPVHRAIVFEMLRSRILSKAKPVKVKKITGAVIGNWHPHGDSSVEEALVGMAQPWSNTLPTIWIKGNGGSIFGDAAASGRYIEARLTTAGDAYGHKLKKGIVPYVPNFDDTDEMPTILPAQLPYLLINGSGEGIAVGIASSLPPHNAKEAVAMTLEYLRHPKTKTEDLLKIMPGPDFPSGATIINQDDLLAMYETGEGRIMVRATVEYDPDEHALHVREIPFSFAGSMDNLVAGLVAATTETTNSQKKKVPPKIAGINSVNNYSGKDGIDICLELAKGVDPDEILKTLYAKTGLEAPVKFQFNALNGQQFHQYSLRQYLAEYTEFQHEIVTNEHLLEKEELNRRMEIIKGRIIAASYIDEIVDVVKHSTGRPQVIDVLMHGTILPDTNKAYHKTVKTFQFTALQAEAISGTPLYQLNKLDTERLAEEGLSVQKRLAVVTRIIEDRAYRHKEIIRRLEAEYKKLPDVPRQTRIISDHVSKASEKETPTVPLYVGMDHYGYVRIEAKPFEGSVETDNKSRIGFFDRTGNCWNLFLDKTKETKDRGTLISQLIDCKEPIIGFTTAIHQETERESLFLFENGALRRVSMSRYWTKTHATKVNTRTPELPLKEVLDIPSGCNVVHIDGTDYPLSEIPLQSLSGSGRILVQPKDEPSVIAFRQDDTVKEKPAKNTAFDAVAIFTSDGQLLFDWSTVDVSGKEGLYVTTYQDLIKSTLLFTHTDGTAKRVEGSQFVVKTKRTQIVADKEGCEILDIRPATEETLIGQYEGGKQKRIEVGKIPVQTKTGGGVRVFYTTKYRLESVLPGEGSDLPIVSFATLPK